MKRRATVESMIQSIGLDLAVEYHRALPQRIETYLRARGIPEALINKHLLGWNGERITIPVFSRDGELAFFRLAKEPEDQSDAPKMLSLAGAPVELYGWERVMAKPCRIIICEGEFDRLVLEAQGFPAVTSTGGAGVFRAEWAEVFAPIPDVYVCFDRDEAGRRGAERVARLIPHAKLVELPVEVGDGGDVTDFFVRLGCSRDDFLLLLDGAQSLPPEEAPADDKQHRPCGVQSDRDVDHLKAAVPIEGVISRYVGLRLNGQTFVGRCPFHEDHRPSFVVYPATRSFYCFGCQARGDVLHFLMRVENMTFPEALETLRRLAASS